MPGPDLKQIAEERRQRDIAAQRAAQPSRAVPDQDEDSPPLKPSAMFERETMDVKLESGDTITVQEPSALDVTLLYEMGVGEAMGIYLTAMSIVALNGKKTNRKNKGELRWIIDNVMRTTDGMNDAVFQVAVASATLSGRPVPIQGEKPEEYTARVEAARRESLKASPEAR